MYICTYDDGNKRCTRSRTYALTWSYVCVCVSSIADVLTYARARLFCMSPSVQIFLHRCYDRPSPNRISAPDSANFYLVMKFPASYLMQTVQSPNVNIPLRLPCVYFRPWTNTKFTSDATITNIKFRFSFSLNDCNLQDICIMLLLLHFLEHFLPATNPLYVYNLATLWIIVIIGRYKYI